MRYSGTRFVRCSPQGAAPPRLLGMLAGIDIRAFEALTESDGSREHCCGYFCQNLASISNSW